jgi:hypothetical protein
VYYSVVEELKLLLGAGSLCKLPVTLVVSELVICDAVPPHIVAAAVVSST